MGEFTYTALDSAGKQQKGNITAETENQALEKLKAQELYPISVKEANILNKEMDLTIGKVVSNRDLSVFCRQFVSMLSAGVTIVSALDMLGQQTENKYMAKALHQVQGDILKGETLATAMRKQNKIFPELMVNMISAGEASGKLEVSFERMATHFEKAEKTQGMIRKAAIYPIVVALVAVIIVAIMLIKVVPSYVEMFEQMDIEMPAITQFVINASDFLVKYWYLVVAVIAVIVVAVKVVGQTDDGKLAAGKAAVNIPLFGKLNIKTISSLTARTLSTLIYSGMPLVDSLEIVSRTLENELYRRALLKTQEEVSQGVPLSVSLKRTGLFPPMVTHMIGIGEETGEIEEMLTKLADYYDEEVEMTTQTVMAALEPMIILVMAGAVGFIIAAVMSPMIAMYGNMGNL